MNYEKMWKELKNVIKDEKLYYQKGVMCSIAESINGERICDEILSYIKKIENKESEGAEND